MDKIDFYEDVLFYFVCLHLFESPYLQLGADPFLRVFDFTVQARPKLLS